MLAARRHARVDRPRRQGGRQHGPAGRGAGRARQRQAHRTHRAAVGRPRQTARTAGERTVPEPNICRPVRRRFSTWKNLTPPSSPEGAQKRLSRGPTKARRRGRRFGRFQTGRFQNLTRPTKIYVLLCGVRNSALNCF